MKALFLGGVAVGVPDEQNVFQFNKALYSLGTWTGDMNDKGFTGISRQGFLRREKKNQDTSCAGCFHGTRIFLLPGKVSCVKVHQGNLYFTVRSS